MAKTTKKDFLAYRNARLDLEKKILWVDETISTYLIKYRLTPDGAPRILSKNLLDEEKKERSFELLEVTAEEIQRYRQNGIPSFVLKYDGKLYWSCIPNNISFFSGTLFGSHMCATGNIVCNKLSAAREEEGGCQRVRDASASGIEKYPWILQGYATYATKYDCFVVTLCEHFQKCGPRRTIPTAEKNSIKLSLAQFRWDDVATVADIFDRMK